MLCCKGEFGNNLKMKLRKFTLIIAAIPIIFLLNCSRKNEQIKLGFDYLEKGNFDAALEGFQKLYREYPEDADVRKGLGYVLSLRKISIASSINLLEEYLRNKKDPEARKELFKLYLDTGMLDQADRLYASDRITVEEFLSRETAIYRGAIACLNEPGKRTVTVLKKIPPSPLRDYYIARCMLKDSYKPDPAAEIKEITDSLSDTELRCELESLMTEKHILDDIRHRVIMRECRLKFPGSLTIWREKPIVIQEAGIPKLFDDSILAPPEPDRAVMEKYKKLVEEKSSEIVN